ncbi:hypothetical protein FGO68_gene12840 [Halteria grandinella]|uniref:Uncharacterized protein n=1 Tax=Halteria grandinella TaxID=5974 RepID=A0A8J8P898_HALGN|nr:hypothetical protein FGO68_gene12840 [Halteria grandinella]
MRGCKSEKHKQMVDIISRPHMQTTIKIRGTAIRAKQGLAKVPVLASALFNVYRMRQYAFTRRAQLNIRQWYTGDIIYYVRNRLKPKGHKS